MFIQISLHDTYLQMSDAGPDNNNCLANF